MTTPTTQPLLQLEEALNPRQYLSHFTKHNVRPDNRPLHACRTTTVLSRTFTKHRHTGSALIRLGDTQCVAVTNLEVGSCSAGNDRGDIVVQLSCENRDHAMEYGAIEGFLNSLFGGDAGGLFDLKQLVIVGGSKSASSGKALNLAWKIVVNVVCLNEDGNVKDAAFLAVLTALLDASIPLHGKDFIIRDDSGLVQMIDNDEGIRNDKSTSHESNKIVFKKVPVPLTIGIFDDDKLLVDPTSSEERVLNGTITVVMTANGEIVSIHKPGGAALRSDQIAACMQLGIGRAKEIEKIFMSSMRMK